MERRTELYSARLNSLSNKTERHAKEKELAMGQNQKKLVVFLGRKSTRVSRFGGCGWGLLLLHRMCLSNSNSDRVSKISWSEKTHTTFPKCSLLSRFSISGRHCAFPSHLLPAKPSSLLAAFVQIYCSLGGSLTFWAARQEVQCPVLSYGP